MFYLKDKVTGAEKTLKTDDKAQATRLLRATNDAELMPALNLQLAEFI